MCESSVYMKKENEEELLMENVAAVQPLPEGKLLLRGLLGERMEVKGVIHEINLMGHKIYIKTK